MRDPFDVINNNKIIYFAIYWVSNTLNVKYAKNGWNDVKSSCAIIFDFFGHLKTPERTWFSAKKPKSPCLNAYYVCIFPKSISKSNNCFNNNLLKDPVRLRSSGIMPCSEKKTNCSFMVIQLCFTQVMQRWHQNKSMNFISFCVQTRMYYNTINKLALDKLMN